MIVSGVSSSWVASSMNSFWLSSVRRSRSSSRATARLTTTHEKIENSAREASETSGSLVVGASGEHVATFGADHVVVGLRALVRDAGLTLGRLVLGLLPEPLAPDAFPQAPHREAIRLRPLEPVVLLLGLQRRYLGVVTPRQLPSPPGRVEAGGDVRHVHERLRGVAGDPRRADVPLTENVVPVAQPVADPPSGTAAHDPEAAPIVEPLRERHVIRRAPRDVADGGSRSLHQVPIFRHGRHRDVLIRTHLGPR